jgi:threonine synthase
VFPEPAAAAPLAGIRRARLSGLVGSQDVVVHVVTGGGLKDIKAAKQAMPSPHGIAPTLEAIREELE